MGMIFINYDFKLKLTCRTIFCHFSLDCTQGNTKSCKFALPLKLKVLTIMIQYFKFHFCKVRDPSYALTYNIAVPAGKTWLVPGSQIFAFLIV